MRLTKHWERETMPNIRQLEYLVAIAETLNFRRAAERTNTTQPTLSEQLKVLEQRLGVQLVERSRSGVMMTSVGAQVVDIARRMLRDADEIRALTAIGGSELSGLLRLGLPPTIGPYLLPTFVPTLHTHFPDLKLYIREEPPRALSRALQDGALDAIITLLPVAGADFNCVPLFREPLHLVVAVDHPLAKQSVVQRSDLRGQDVLTLGPIHQLHEVVLALCDEFGARLRHDFEGTSLDTLREMVVMGLGITFLPGLYVRREIINDPNLKVLGLHGRAVHRSVGIVWRKASARQASYERLAEFFRAAMVDEFSATGR
jgi:LysR family transcriptional regulator, hydrogen peroxide-inducible genes activator